jgi:Uma2 family endonuclease
MHHYTFADYLTLERFSNVKHEFLDGDIMAMTGGSPKHAKLAVTISSLLHSQLRGGRCVFSSTCMRVPRPDSRVPRRHGRVRRAEARTSRDQPAWSWRCWRLDRS